MTAWPVEPADIMDALAALPGTPMDRIVRYEHSADTLRAAARYAAAGRAADDSITFADSQEYEEAAVHHVLDLIRDVPLAASVRLALGNALEVGPEDVGTLKARGKS